MRSMSAKHWGVRHRLGRTSAAKTWSGWHRSLAAKRPEKDGDT
jgi:hypothetical protein